MQSWAVAYIKIKKQVLSPDPSRLVYNYTRASFFNNPEFTRDYRIDYGVGFMYLLCFTHAQILLGNMVPFWCW